MGNDEKKAQQELENKKEEMEDKTEEMKGKLSLASDLAKQTYQFGLYLNLLATWHGSLALPWGLAAAGAAMTRTFVDGGDVKGTAKATALMVKLGLLNLVRDIVANLSQQDRSDVVSQVTVGLLEEGEVGVVSQINNALLKGGYTKEAAAVGAEMGSQVTTGVFKGLKEAGANLLHGKGSSTPAKSSAPQESDHGMDDKGINSDKSVLQSVKEGTSNLLGAS